VSHYALAIYTKKYLKAKEELYGNSNISPCKNTLNPLKNPLRIETQNRSRYYNSIIPNLKFQHKPKYHLSKKNLI
jgi:hypothetical protein